MNIVAHLIRHAYPNNNETLQNVDSAVWAERFVSTHFNNNNIDKNSRININDNDPNNNATQFFRDFITKTNNTIKNKHCLWKTHAYFSNFPARNINRKTKLIYILRNPKDALISAFHFFIKNENTGFKGDLNLYFQLFISGTTICGDYWHHCCQWYDKYINQKKLGLNILWIYYEDLKTDVNNELKRIGKFLEIDNLDELMIKSIINATNFNKMKKQAKNGKIQDYNSQFFRSGKVDDWKNYLTNEQSFVIDQITYARFNGMHIKYWYKAKENIEKHVQMIQEKQQLVSKL